MATCADLADPARAPTSSLELLIHQGGAPLVRQVFPSYEVALESGPFIVDVSDGTLTQPHEIMIGNCDWDCVGPVTREAIDVYPSPPYLSSIVGLECVGLDGWLEYSGIDSHAAGGDCAD